MGVPDEADAEGLLATEPRVAPQRDGILKWPRAYRVLFLVSFGAVLVAASRGHAWGTLRFSSKEAVQLSSDDTPIGACKKVFGNILGDGSRIEMGHYNFDTRAYKPLEFWNSKQVAELLKDPRTNIARMGKCSMQAKSVVWFYPDKSGDSQHAFLLASGECKRMETILKEPQVECLAVYRVPSLDWIIEALNTFHGPGTIVHAVLGGHGSDSRQDEGVLVLSEKEGDTVEENSGGYVQANTAALGSMLVALQTKLSPRATIFLDSCFAGVNGMAKAVSARLPDHWIFGGVVSLTSFITVKQTPFNGGPEGPTRVVSEYSTATVLNLPSAVKHPDRDGLDMKVTNGYTFGPDQETGEVHLGDTKEFDGERLLGYYGGKNMGSVTQWRFPSKNNRVIRVGLQVKVHEVIQPFKLEVYEAGLAAFPNPLVRGMTGTVVFMMNGGQVPTAGNAIINFELPDELAETKGGGASTGPLVVLSSDFDKLEVL